VTEDLTKIITPLSVPKLDETSSPEDGVIPPRPKLLAEVQPPKPGQALLDVQLTLDEMGAISASIQTCVHSGWIRQTSALNVVNSVLRKFHDIKARYVQEHPE